MDFVPRPNRSKPDPVNVPLLDADGEADSPSSAIEIAFYIESRFFFGLLAKYLEVEPRLEDYVKEVDGHFGRFICLDKLANSFYGEGERYFLYEGNLSLKSLKMHQASD
ncbi:hypothetical protein N7520_008037 [Penicillium odoratum]|uniref:uncharacterized protein n=1 Tax=Penicillium odoratum TaxID=1167516 RepID=UPI0025467E7A|nr:uncharacterized protein N7520_008037 [Penicillium odoratum]KAJ5760881.1 hypothetical protein N7520_008037 [Penicillium odoratum]